MDLLKEIIKLGFAYLFLCGAALLSYFISILFAQIPIRLFRLNPEDNIFSSRHFWIGYPIFISILIAINIFLPLNGLYSLIIMTILCLIIVLCSKKVIINFLKNQNDQKVRIFFTIVLGTFLALLFLKSNFDPSEYSFDTYNYHFNSLRLINDYPAIRGVINLFAHYGISYSVLYHASFLSNFIPEKSFLDAYLFLATSLTLVVGIFMTLYAKVEEILRMKFYGTREFSTQFYASFILFATLIFIVLSFYPSLLLNGTGTTGIYRHVPDLNYYLLSFIFICYFISFLSFKKKMDLFVLWSIALSLVMNKLSAAFIVLLSFFFMLIYLRKQNELRKIFWLSLCFIFIVATPYLLQNIIHSGAILFPISFTDLNLPWSNKPLFTPFVSLALSWARNPNIIEGDYGKWKDWGWLLPWAKMFRKFFLFFLLLYAIGFYLLIIQLWKKRGKGNTKVKIYWLSVSSILWIGTLLYWLLTAPDVRFAGMLFIFPILILYALLDTYYLIFKDITVSKIFFIFLFSYFLSIFSIFKPIILRIAGIGIVSYFLSTKKESINMFLKKKIQLEWCFPFLIVILFFSVLDWSKIKTPISIPDFDDNLISQSIDGVTVYKGKWAWEKLCSYTQLQPCTVQDWDKEYTWIDSTKWWRGIVKKSSLATENEKKTE